MFDRILFDIDGSIVNSEKLVRESLAQLMREELGVEKSPDDIAFYCGIPGIDSLRILGFPNPEKSNKRWRALIEQQYDQVTLYPGIKEVLRKLLARGCTLGLITSKTHQEYESQFLGRFAIDSFFEDCICADDTVRHKPDPDPILEYLRIHKGDPARTLYVGDTVHDFNCAEQAKVSFAMALWSNSKSGVFQAVHQLKTPSDLLRLLSSSDK